MLAGDGLKGAGRGELWLAPPTIADEKRVIARCMGGSEDTQCPSPDGSLVTR